MIVIDYTKEEILKELQTLMDTGQGDIGRLRFILMSLRKGNPLYQSDRKYLEKKLKQEFNIIQKTPKRDTSKSKNLQVIKELIKI